MKPNFHTAVRDVANAATASEAADYIHEMLKCLHGMAIRPGNHNLRYLLWQAIVEAKRIRDDGARPLSYLSSSTATHEPGTAEAENHWVRDDTGHVCLTPVLRCATGVTDHGEIALSFRGRLPSAPGSDEHCGQYVCSTSGAMNVARMLVRAVALADDQISAPKVAAQTEAAE